MLTYQATRPLDVHAYPSLRAPKVGTKESGKRFRGYAPVHFWVALAQGEGWVRVDAAALRVLGRPPLSALETASPRGFARFLRLPDDAELATATARMVDGFFKVEMQRRPPLPQEAAADEATAKPPPPDAS